MNDINKPSRTRLSPLQRKKQLLDIAIDVFATRGIDKAGHGDIAKIAQVSVATVFNYFPTKEDLVQQVLKEIQNYIFSILEQNTQKDASINHNIENFCYKLMELTLVQNNYVKIWFEWSTSSCAYAKELFKSAYSAYLEYLTDMFHNAIEKQEITSYQNASHLAKLSHGFYYSIYLETSQNQTTIHSNQLITHFLSFLTH